MKKYTFLLCALLIAACSSDKAADTQQYSGKNTKQAKSSTLVIGTINALTSLPLWVAQDEGVFDSLGVDVKVKDFRDQLECDMSFVKGKTQIILTDSVRVGWMTSAHKTQSTKLKTVGMPLTLVANAKARVTELKQLKEKILAVTRHSIAAQFGNHCIDSVKLNRDDVYVVQINDPNVALKMIQNNELDAAFMPEPQSSLALKGGNKALFKRTAKGFLIAKPKTFDEKQKKAFLDAYNEAVKRIESNGLEYYSNMISHHCKCSEVTNIKSVKIKF